VKGDRTEKQRLLKAGGGLGKKKKKRDVLFQKER